MSTPNTGGSYLCSNTLPLDHGGGPAQSKKAGVYWTALAISVYSWVIYRDFMMIKQRKKMAIQK